LRIQNLLQAQAWIQAEEDLTYINETVLAELPHFSLAPPQGLDPAAPMPHHFRPRSLVGNKTMHYQVQHQGPDKTCLAPEEGHPAHTTRDSLNILDMMNRKNSGKF